MSAANIQAHFWLNFIMEANTMNLDQNGSSLISVQCLQYRLSKNKQMREADDKHHINLNYWQLSVNYGIFDWEIFHEILMSADFFSKSTFLKKFFQEYHQCQTVWF